MFRQPKHHIAIMKKEWGLLEGVITGQKKIESRFYSQKVKPWDDITEKDTVYFKNTGGKVEIKAGVKKVLQFENLDPKKVKELITKHHIGLGLKITEIPYFLHLFQDKKYAILIFLKKIEKIEPFDIDKDGISPMSGWITVDDIAQISLT